MKLKLITQADFRKGEHTNLADLKAVHDMKTNEVVCLVSKTGKQLCFVYAPIYIEPGRTPAKGQWERVVVRSEKLRLTHGGTWNPLMLANYAESVGITLDGIKKFETYYKDLHTLKA